MNPVKFKKCNKTLVVNGCKDLPVQLEDGVILSKWKLSFFEAVKVLFTKSIWLYVRGESLPPLFITTKE